MNEKAQLLEQTTHNDLKILEQMNAYNLFPKKKCDIFLFFFPTAF